MDYRRCIVCGMRFYLGKASFFAVPKDPKTREKWKKNLAITRKLCSQCFVCEKHFERSDILTGSPPTFGRNGEVLIASVPYKVKRLRPGAEPISINTSLDVNLPIDNSSNLSLESKSDSSLSESTSETALDTITISSTSTENEEALLFDNSPATDIPPILNYSKIEPMLEEIALPSTNWNFHRGSDARVIVFYAYNYIRNNGVLKEIIISMSDFKVKILGRDITIDQYPQTVAQLTNFIAKIDRMSICLGFPFYEYFKKPDFDGAEKMGDCIRHKKCSFIIEHGNICLKCYSLEGTLFSAADNSRTTKKIAHGLNTSSSEQTPNKIICRKNKAKSHKVCEDVKIQRKRAKLLNDTNSVKIAKKKSYIVNKIKVYLNQ